MFELEDKIEIEKKKNLQRAKINQNKKPPTIFLIFNDI